MSRGATTRNTARSKTGTKATAGAADQAATASTDKPFKPKYTPMHGPGARAKAEAEKQRAHSQLIWGITSGVLVIALSAGLVLAYNDSQSKATAKKPDAPAVAYEETEDTDQYVGPDEPQTLGVQTTQTPGFGLGSQMGDSLQSPTDTVIGLTGGSAPLLRPTAPSPSAGTVAVAPPAVTPAVASPPPPPPAPALTPVASPAPAPAPAPAGPTTGAGTDPEPVPGSTPAEPAPDTGTDNGGDTGGTPEPTPAPSPTPPPATDPEPTPEPAPEPEPVEETPVVADGEDTDGPPTGRGNGAQPVKLLSSKKAKKPLSSDE